MAITNGAADVLARSLALELAPIRVNAISPGVIDTGAWDALGEQGKADYFADISARNPARRIGTADDIANGVLFAMTSTFLTGADPAHRRRRTAHLIPPHSGPSPARRNRKGALQWAFPGSKDRSHRERSAAFSFPIRSRSGCCSPSRCAGGCGSGSAAPGSPTARTSCCCTSPAATRWPTSRSTTSADSVLEPSEHTTRHRDLGPTSWFTVRAGAHSTPRAAWQHTELPGHASDLKGRVAFAWRAMDAFYEEDERIVGHAADSYHRIDIRQTSRHLTVRHQDRVIADSTRPLVLYESGFAPRWYVPRADIDASALTPAEGQTFCPYKGLCQLLRHRRRA